MKTILLLNDETAAARLQLINAAPDPSATRLNEGSLGCNCDRWGHPCADCVTHSLEPKTELPFTGPTEK